MTQDSEYPKYCSVENLNVDVNLLFSFGGGKADRQQVTRVRSQKPQEQIYVS